MANQEGREVIKGFLDTGLDTGEKQWNLISSAELKSMQKAIEDQQEAIRELVSGLIHEVQTMENVDPSSDQYLTGYAECMNQVLVMLENRLYDNKH